ncbi:hypothetical protein AAMO2058_000144900 [Amorphochlora amoebiformis]|mmetsp:Transcript_33617/g.54106  ORF Transcript_33617/g.54106 Transcript_33617/m.54106 type:complete len:319 (-) Transcript_33617:355-1311(-)
MLKKGTCRAGRGGRRVGAGRKSNFERAAARRVEAEQKKIYIFHTRRKPAFPKMDIFLYIYIYIVMYNRCIFCTYRHQFSKRQKKMEEQEAKRQKNKHTAAGSRKPLEGGDPHEPAHDGELEPRRPNYQGDHDDHVGHDQVNHSDDGKQEKNDYDDHVDDSDPGDYNDGDGILGNCNDRKVKDEDLKKKAGVDDLGNVDSGVDSELIPDEQSPSFPAPHHMKVSEPAYQVYLDVWHLMDRPYISKTHGAIVRFYRDMREALFCMDKIDRKSVTTVLRRKGFSDIKRGIARSRIKPTKGWRDGGNWICILRTVFNLFIAL